jgi:hypothetical protein
MLLSLRLDRIEKNAKEATQMKIEVTNQKSQISVAIKYTAVGMEDLAKIMGEGYPKLMGYIAEQGKNMVGAPYCAYMNCNEDYSQFDIDTIPQLKAI